MFGSLSDSLQVWLGVMGVVIAIVLPVIVHRATHPKRQVSYRLRTAPTVFADAAGSHPAVEARLEVWCTGRADVPASRFDGAVPLTFRFRDRVLSLVPEHGSPEAWRFARGEDDHDLTLGPVPLVRGAVLATTVIVERTAEMRVWSPLVDTDVVVADAAAPQVQVVTSATRSRRRLGALGFGVIFAVAGVALVLLSFVIAIGFATAGTEPTDAGYQLIGFLVLIGLGVLGGGVVTMIVAGIGRLARGRRPAGPS